MSKFQEPTFIETIKKDLLNNKNDFKKKYICVENSSDGNCLFESIALALPDGPDYETIRQEVCQWYRDFDRDIKYPETTLEFAISMSLLYDDFDDDGQRHEIAMGNPYVWGNLTDVMVCALIYDLQINVFNETGWSQTFGLESSTPILLFYSSNNHFQYVVGHGESFLN